MKHQGASADSSCTRTSQTVGGAGSADSDHVLRWMKLWVCEANAAETQVKHQSKLRRKPPLADLPSEEELIGMRETVFADI